MAHFGELGQLAVEYDVGKDRFGVGLVTGSNAVAESVTGRGSVRVRALCAAAVLHIYRVEDVVRTALVRRPGSVAAGARRSGPGSAWLAPWAAVS